MGEAVSTQVKRRKIKKPFDSFGGRYGEHVIWAWRSKVWILYVQPVQF